MRPGKIFFDNGEIRFTSVYTDHGEKPLVIYPVASAVLALQKEPQSGRETVVLVEQHRIGAGRPSIEIPAGKAMASETPEECARRELEEETGLIAENLRNVHQYYPAIGICTELLYLFEATQLTQGTKNPDVDEVDMLVHNWTFEQFEESIQDGDIIDGKTILAYYYWKMKRLRAQSRYSG